MIMSRVGEKLLMKLPKIKMIKHIEKIAGWPKRAISQVFARRLVTFVARNALVRNCALSRPTPKVPMTFGIATLAIVLAKTITKNAINATVTTMPR